MGMLVLLAILISHHYIVLQVFDGDIRNSNGSLADHIHHQLVVMILFQLCLHRGNTLRSGRVRNEYRLFYPIVVLGSGVGKEDGLEAFIGSFEYFVTETYLISTTRGQWYEVRIGAIVRSIFLCTIALPDDPRIVILLWKYSCFTKLESLGRRMNDC